MLVGAGGRELGPVTVNAFRSEERKCAHFEPTSEKRAKNKQQSKGEANQTNSGKRQAQKQSRIHGRWTSNKKSSGTKGHKLDIKENVEERIRGRSESRGEGRGSD